MKDSRKRKSKHRARSSRPLILVSPHSDVKGAEFGDTSTSLSETYQRAIEVAGGTPLILPLSASPEVIAQSVALCDGVLLTGGDDVDPKLYAKKLPKKLAKTVEVDASGRDIRELILIDEIFLQRKPVFGICRGHQIMNVALGGSLIVDIPSQMPAAINHRRMDKRSAVVHQARLTAGSMLARITRKKSLGVNSTHHQALGRIADPLRVTATGPDGVAEGTELKPEHARLLPYLMTVQFHPERLAPRYPEHQALFNHFVRSCKLNRK